MNWEISFRVTKESVDRFAGFTGDRNPLHLDEQFARRFRYRQPVAHGMLAFSYLSFLQSAFPQRPISFTKLAGQFRRPIFIGSEIICTMDYTETQPNHFEFSATWKNRQSHEEAIVATGQFVTTSSENEFSKSNDTTTSFVDGNIEERSYSIGEVEGKNESFPFSISKQAAKTYAETLAEFVWESAGEMNAAGADANLLSTSLLSTLIGMKLPGRYATFLNFEVAFDAPISWNNLHTLHGRVAKVSTAGSRISVATEFKIAARIFARGSCTALVNSPPKQMLTTEQIKMSHADLGLKNKVILITGASRGIGEVTAKLFATLGAKVIVGYYKGKEDAEQIVCEITQAGGEAIAFQCDIRDEAEVKNMIAAVLERYGDIDVLVNNAVKDATPKNFSELEWSDFLGEMEVSLKGLHNCCKSVIPIFQQKRRGKIINLSTVAADSPVTGQAKYITAKNAVVGYTRSLGKELAKDNIQANVVAPNMVETDIHATLGNAVRDRLAEERDYGRHVQPIEVAQSIAFLASNWSDAMTGQKIVLNIGENPFL